MSHEERDRNWNQHEFDVEEEVYFDFSSSYLNLDYEKDENLWLVKIKLTTYSDFDHQELSSEDINDFIECLKYLQAMKNEVYEM